MTIVKIAIISFYYGHNNFYYGHSDFYYGHLNLCPVILVVHSYCDNIVILTIKCFSMYKHVSAFISFLSEQELLNALGIRA